MSNSEFPNLDFRFRTGYMSGFEQADIVDGSLNFISDTQELIVQKDGEEYSVSGIEYKYTEDEVRALSNPAKGKLYVTTDTKRALHYNPSTLSFDIVGNKVDHADNADIATKDDRGNKISEFYIPRKETEYEIKDIRATIEALKNAIASLDKMDPIFIEDKKNLPKEGEKGVIYLVPAKSWYEKEVTTDYCVELIWVTSSSLGSYYEVIGNSDIIMTDYYTKAEIEEVLKNFKLEISNEVQNLIADIINDINTLRSLINSIKAADETRFTNIETNIIGINTTLSTQGNAISNLQSDMSDGNANRSGTWDYGEEV